MITTVRYVLLTALRDWLFSGLLIGVVAATYISAVLGSTAMVETQAMTLSFAAASARVIVVVGLIVFVCFHIRGAFDSREIDVILSRPLSRTSLVLSYWVAFSVVALLLVVPTLGVLWYLGVVQKQGFFLWAASFVLEVLLVVALALFSGFTLRSAVTAVMACFGFYVLARMIGFFIATTHSSLIFKSLFFNQLSGFIINGVSMIIPRLDFYGKSEWLIYGVSDTHEWALFMLQSGVFIPLLLMATIIDFCRKQF